MSPRLATESRGWPHRCAGPQDESESQHEECHRRCGRHRRGFRRGGRGAAGAVPAVACLSAATRVPAAGLSADSRFRDTNFATPTLGPGVALTGDGGRSALYDVGIGARFLPFFRADITASCLPSLHFSGGDNIGAGSANTARIHSWVGLVNAYFEFSVLTIFGPMEPYLDVGLGAAISF